MLYKIHGILDEQGRMEPDLTNYFIESMATVMARLSVEEGPCWAYPSMLATPFVEINLPPLTAKAFWALMSRWDLRPAPEAGVGE